MTTRAVRIKTCTARNFSKDISNIIVSPAIFCKRFVVPFLSLISSVSILNESRILAEEFFFSIRYLPGWLLAT